MTASSFACFCLLACNHKVVAAFSLVFALVIAGQVRIAVTARDVLTQINFVTFCIVDLSKFSFVLFVLVRHFGFDFFFFRDSCLHDFFVTFLGYGSCFVHVIICLTPWFDNPGCHHDC